MELLFLLIAGCLVLLALLFILPPLWRQRPIAKAAIDERNIAIAKHRLAELTEQLQANALSQAQYDEQRAELEQALSDDLDIQTQEAASSSQSRWLSYLLMILLPVLAGSLYGMLGNYKAISPTPEMLGTNAQAIPNQAQLEKMVNGLAEQMKAEPNNADGWLMLGKSYKYLQQYPKAVDAFAQAYLLLGDKPDVMLQYAEALSFANDQQVTGKAAELVFKALALEPNNPNALWLAGMAKAQANDFVEAKKLWTKLAASLPEGSEALRETQDLLATIDSKISTTQSKETVKPTSAENASNNASTTATEVAVDVKVSLAPELQNQISPTDTLFVYAQASSGPQMPLAIVRKQVSDLPLSVSLTDTLAMTPAMKLSNFTQVKLLARISKSGNAMKQAGDLIGVIEDVTVADKTPHTLIINSVVK